MEEIKAKIPHREPFLFIDRILESEPGKVVAERTISPDEPQFKGHYPGNPIMPGVLLCEAAFQTGAVLLVNELEASNPGKEGDEGGVQEITPASGKTPVLARIEDARFKSMVKPGDVIRIEVCKTERLGQFHFLEGKIIREKKTVATLRFALALVDEDKGA